MPLPVCHRSPELPPRRPPSSQPSSPLTTGAPPSENAHARGLAGTSSSACSTGAAGPPSSSPRIAPSSVTMKEHRCHSDLLLHRRCRRGTPVPSIPVCYKPRLCFESPRAARDRHAAPPETAKSIAVPCFCRAST
ncbi:hypothetical protein VPH35_065610 [Triticum aestivum]